MTREELRDALAEAERAAAAHSMATLVLSSDDLRTILASLDTEAALTRTDALAEAREALRQSKEGWNNAVEMGLLPPQHHATARELSEQCFAALSRLNAQGEVK